MGRSGDRLTAIVAELSRRLPEISGITSAVNARWSGLRDAEVEDLDTEALLVRKLLLHLVDHLQVLEMLLLKSIHWGREHTLSTVQEPVDALRAEVYRLGEEVRQLQARLDALEQGEE